MDPHSLHRRRIAAAFALLAVSGASAGVAWSLAPGTVRSEGVLDARGAGKLRGDEPVVRRVEFELPRMREDELARVRVRFANPACGGAEGAAEAKGAPAALVSRSPEVLVTLAAMGFQVGAESRRIVLAECTQSVVWDVVPRRAPSHRLAFRFESSTGDVEVTPSVFNISVAGPLFLPSSTLFHGATAFSAASALVGLGNLLGALRKWAENLRGVLRRRAGGARSSPP